jgi:hypothetical protein
MQSIYFQYSVDWWLHQSLIAFPATTDAPAGMYFRGASRIQCPHRSVAKASSFTVPVNGEKTVKFCALFQLFFIHFSRKYGNMIA